MRKERKIIVVIIIIFILFSYTLKIATTIKYNAGNNSISLKIEEKSESNCQNPHDEGDDSTEVIVDDGDDDDMLAKINDMSEDELMDINGIGEVLAKRIVDYKDENGDFKEVDELMKIKGIGQKKLEKIMEDI
jgi:competence protein ComEA